ncbi:hypothetical protein N7475_007658 [Penicillium sp. IBT 31633x]|nr:hypothetical protein N7475_007658 [Penicillium sp. IBT 31633x]
MHFQGLLSITTILSLVLQGSAAQGTAGTGTCRHTTVAILGGGMAGITAAQALNNQSIADFVIVEYQNRIGGRVNHTTFGQKADGTSYVVELGAYWVHGVGATNGSVNPILRLAQKYNLTTALSDFSSIQAYDDTGSVNYTYLLDEYETASEKMAEIGSTILKNNLQDMSIRQGMALGGWKPKVDDMAAQAVDWLKGDVENASPVGESSLAFSLAAGGFTFGQFGPDNYLITDPRGYSAIIEGEAATFLKKNDSRLLLNTKVTNISYSDTGVTVYNHDGTCIAANYAICTFSLGVLQNVAVDFNPELPLWKRTAIQRFTMGTYTKIFMQFNETFWPKNSQNLLYASPDRRGYYASFQSLSAPGFLEGSNILFATVLAEEAYRVERLSDDETQAEIMAVLRQMFPGTTIPEPTAFLYPRWNKAEWAYGSYSNWPLGTTLEMHQNLRANTSRLWFAGEATSSQYFGFLHGAWFEGREAGAQIAGLIQGHCTNVTGENECGGRKYYETLAGTTPSNAYTVVNGWPGGLLY